MKACLGDYIKFDLSSDGLVFTNFDKVVAICRDMDGLETYETQRGSYVSESELDIDSVLLESEVNGA